MSAHPPISSPGPAGPARLGVPRAGWIALGCGLVLAAAGGVVYAAARDARAAWEPLLNLAVLVPMAIALARGLATRRETVAWTGVALGLAVTAVAGAFGMPSGHAAPDGGFGAGDVLWIVRYPLLYGALALLVAARSPRIDVRAVLDGLVGAFALAGLFALAVGPWLVDGALADPAVTDLRSLYPVLDVLALGFLAGAAVLNGWPRWVWVPLVADMTLFLAGNTVDIRAGLRDPGEPLGWSSFPLFLASAWCLAFAIFALQQTAGRRIVEPGPRPALPPVVLGAVAVATLLGASGAYHRLAAALAGASLVAALARQWLVNSDNARLLDHARREALTDALTGLANRRALIADLQAAAFRATEERPLTLALFDLDGFKHYNDTFGHPAGDSLLQRLGQALHQTVHPAARAYRMGGDEFCILVTGSEDPSVPVAAARRALSDRGEGFDIGASAGIASLPGDARDVTDVLRLADQRMYAEKGTGRRRRVPDVDATAALLQIVRERDPSLGSHTHEVAGWAADVAAALGAGRETVEIARLGGELHDIGKTAIPDAILDKPGPLDDDEWEFMRRHTVIGERILLADPALAPVAPVARSHHERWTGGGYPDGLAGEEIPLVARIVAVCDAYEAMVADRAYRAGRSRDEAIDELLRCSGEQFDPAVVEAFISVVAPERAVILA